MVTDENGKQSNWRSICSSSCTYISVETVDFYKMEIILYNCFKNTIKYIEKWHSHCNSPNPQNQHPNPLHRSTKKNKKRERDYRYNSEQKQNFTGYTQLLFLTVQVKTDFWQHD